MVTNWASILSLRVRIMFRLVRASARDKPLCIVSSSNTKAKIGRDPKTCTVQLGTKAVAVSREHADLVWSSSGVTLVDTSSFGTFIDGVKIIKGSILLKGGERVKIGQEEFILEKIEEAIKAAPIIQQSKPPPKTSITSYFTKNNTVLREESQPAEVSARKILAAETPSESQESQKVPSQTIRKPVRGAARRVNPLFNFDDEDESIMDVSRGNILAVETPSDSVTSPKGAAPSVPPSTRAPPTNTVPQASTTVEKKKKMSLFAKPSQRPKTQKPIGDDEIVVLDVDASHSNGDTTSQMDDEFARPSVPSRSRPRTTTNISLTGPSSKGRITNRGDIDSANIRDDMMEVNASSIPTQVIPPIRNTFMSRDAGCSSSEPPKKKAKSFFEDYKKQQKKLQMKKPREKSLLDEDDDGVRVDYRIEYKAPKPVIGERAYSSMENVRAMEQMGKDAEARLNKRRGLDRIDEMESQIPSVEELTSILCSSYAEDKGEEEKDKVEGEVERVGYETLDDEIKSQLVTFCEGLVVSQPSIDSMASVNPSQGKGFKKFKKAKQGRFATQSAAMSGIIGGSDLVDFRQIQM